ncbi:MAG: ATP-binding protein [Streptosporangiaceae bacterium]
MADELELPDELFGFGGWLLWLVATRATSLVDQLFAAGVARPSRAYGMVDGHHVPTPSLVAWLLAAAESGIAAGELPGRRSEVGDRQKVLRTLVSRSVSGDPGTFKDAWLRQLGEICGLTQPEVDVLMTGRGYGPFAVQPAALREAIGRTFRTGFRRGQLAIAMATLPRDLASFTGRAGQLDWLRDTAGAPADPGIAPIVVIAGMAGVGKTALAVHAARRLAPMYPGGQIFLSLHGHTAGQRPVDPGDALLNLLLTAGLRAEQVPPGLEPRSRQWRDWLASRRVVLVLDDAVSAEQVEPLLPGVGGLVLVTSRRRLAALTDARLLELGTLPQEEATDLFSRLAGRVIPDSGDVAAIVAMCGYLPLAIGMLARQLHHHPAWSVADLRADLAAAHDRLAMMSAETRSVAAAFDLSYGYLEPELRRLFRRLASHPGPDFDAWAAAAAFDDRGAGEVRGSLNTLYDHHLLLEPAAGRFAFHDLIREYAQRMAASDGDAASVAANRLVSYYARAAAAAAQRLRRTHPGPGRARPAPAATPVFATSAEATSWLEAEFPSLDAVVRHTAAADRPADVISITLAIFEFLRDSRYAEQGIRLCHLALAAAMDSADTAAQAHVLRCLSALHIRAAEFTIAIGRGRRAVELFRELGDSPGEAAACEYLGWASYLTGDYGPAREYLATALSGFQEAGDILGEADVLTHIGYVNYACDDYQTARERLLQALDIYTVTGDWPGERGALNYLAHVQQALGDYPGAAVSLRRSLDYCESHGDREGEAAIRNNLGYLNCLTGDYQTAVAHLTRALAMHIDAGQRVQQAVALNYLGLAQRLLGQASAAAASQQEAIALFSALGIQLGEANAWQELGLARQLAGEPDALADGERALSIYIELGDRVGQAEALNSIGDTLLASGRPEDARAAYERATSQIGELEAPMEKARALEGIGHSLLNQHHNARAHASLQQALTIYREIGSPRAEQVKVLMTQLPVA